MAIPKRMPLLTLMRLEQAHVNDLRRILTRASRDISAQLNKMPSGTVTALQMRAQRAAIDNYLNRSWEDIEQVVREGRVNAARAASRSISQYEETLTKLVTSERTRDILAASEALRAAAGVETAMRRMEGSSYTPLSKQVYKTKKLADGWVNDTINRGLASGWDAKRLAKEISSSIDPKVPGGVSYAANRLARTEINNAFHASTVKRMQESGIVEVVDWNLSSSHPEGDICDSLASDGPYELNKVPKKPHPHCYCFLTPGLPSEEDFMKKLLSGDYGDEPWASEVQQDKLWDKDGDSMLRKAWGKGDVKVLRDMSGESAADMVKIVQLSNGTKGFIKDPGGWSDAVKERMLMNDVLGSRVTQQLGIRGPRAAIVEYEGRRVVLTEAMDAKVSYEALDNLDDALDVLVTNDSGMVDMTFMDYVIHNKDRHAANWLVDKDGKVVSIDLGESFGSYSQAGDSEIGGFDSQDTFLAMLRNVPAWQNDFDYTGWKSKLGDLKPFFEQAGRAESHSAMMARLDHLKKTIETQYRGVVS